MRKILCYSIIILIVCCLITEVGCANNNIYTSSASLSNASVEHSENTQKTSLNSENSQQDTNAGIQNNDQDSMEATGPETVDNLKSIEIENLNDDNNSKDEDYVEMAKKMLKANKYAYINPNDIEWITMQGGLHIHTKALFPGNDDEKINNIVTLVNSGTGKIESANTEINVINSEARPRGILFKLKNGSKVYAWTDYTTKSFKNGWSATTLDDRFVLNVQNSSQDKYFTIFSKDVAKYLKEGWKADMPMVKEVEVSSESSVGGDKVVISEGDTAIVTGDGCTAKEVVIRIMRNGNPKEIYSVGKVVPEYGRWEWKGSISRQCKTLDDKTVTLANDLYDIIADADGNQTGACGVIDLRDEKKAGN